MDNICNECVYYDNCPMLNAYDDSICEQCGDTLSQYIENHRNEYFAEWSMYIENFYK